MDKFKQQQNKSCPGGGIHCPCCNPFDGKDKPKLNRQARAKLKHETRKELAQQIGKQPHVLENNLL